MASDKLIFAPAGPSKQPGQAAQYLTGTLSRHDLDPSPFAQFHAWFRAAQEAGVPEPETVCLATAAPVTTPLPGFPARSNVDGTVPAFPQRSGASAEATGRDTASSRSQVDPASNPSRDDHASTPNAPSAPQILAMPTCRFVYLKELDSRGFVVYSNASTSQKAHDLALNPAASLAFWWRGPERQVRVEGWAERLTRAESEAYWRLRARGSKMGAWASQQSTVLRRADASHPEGMGADYSNDTRSKNKDDHDDGRAELDGQVRAQEERFVDVPDDQIPLPDFWGGIRIVPLAFEFWQGRNSRLHDRFRYTRVQAKSGNNDNGVGDGEWTVERLSP